MDSEIINKTYNKPREMFDDACLLVANSLKEYDFKYSKSQSTIKKKDKLLTYIISFYSSHYNYIVENKGHVVMEFYCIIKDKDGDIIFRLNKKELRSEIHRFELFDNEMGKLDLKQIENTIDFIQTYFLPVVFEIKNDVNTFLEYIVNQPIARFDDYGFQYEKKIFEIFNRQDLIKKYDNEIEAFNNKIAENDRLRFKKYFLQKIDKNKIEKLNAYELQAILQKIWSSANLESKILKIYYYDNKKRFEKLLKSEVFDKIDWLTDFYILLCSCSDYIEDEKVKEQAFDITGQLRKCFIDNE